MRMTNKAYFFLPIEQLQHFLRSADFVLKDHLTIDRADFSPEYDCLIVVVKSDKLKYPIKDGALLKRLELDEVFKELVIIRIERGE